MNDIKDLLPTENRLLWGNEELPIRKRTRRTNRHVEGDIQNSILKYLVYRKDVAWAKRINTGAVKYKSTAGRDRFVRYGFAGCSDIIGQAKNGRFIAIEVKAPGKRPSELQKQFIDIVKSNGGYSGVARCLEDVDEILNSY